MKAVFSVTSNPLYEFFLPLVAWSWKKLGVDSVVFYPTSGDYTDKEDKRFIIAGNYCPESITMVPINVSSKEYEATYSQVSRLYAACLDSIADEDILITADVDMAVFGNYLLQANTDAIQVFGDDLVDNGQYPICYISMPKKTWMKVMGLDKGYTTQHYLDQQLQPLVCEHMRGNYWALDQETIFNKLTAANIPIIKHGRANWPHRFATRRADRDGWPQGFPADLVDAHLPRPGYEYDNFCRIIDLFNVMYPTEDLTWMIEYREQYIECL